jgi:hypothetical protein
VIPHPAGLGVRLDPDEVAKHTGAKVLLTQVSPFQLSAPPTSAEIACIKN